MRRLAQYLNKPLTLAPQSRSALVQQLLQNSGSPQGIVSPYGTANKALQGLLLRKANIAEREASELSEGRQSALAGALSRTQDQDPAKAEAAKRAALIISGGLPEDPMAKALLGAQAETVFAPNAGADPADIKEYNYAKGQGYEGSFTDYLREFKSREANVSANVQNAKYFESLTPEQRERFVEANRTVPIENIGGVPTRVGSGGAQQPLSSLEREELAKLRLAAAQSQGSTTGTATGTAIANLPLVETTARQALETIASLRNHPGRAAATGTSRNLGPGLQRFGPWSSNVKDFEVLRQQASGQIFLDAYQSLKGGGQITEIEGLKAEQAKARMDAAQTDEEYLSALDEFEKAIKRGLELAKTRAGQPSPQTPQQQGGGDINSLLDKYAPAR